MVVERPEHGLVAEPEWGIGGKWFGVEGEFVVWWGLW
jgi:hypothetical protein